MAELPVKKNTAKNEEAKKVDMVIAPHITEKASRISSHNAYTFVVRNEATKESIKKEIIAAYKVTPKAINIVTVQSKAVFVRGRHGSTKKAKRAIVFLKKGDTIKLA